MKKIPDAKISRPKVRDVIHRERLLTVPAAIVTPPNATLVFGTDLPYTSDVDTIAAYYNSTCHCIR